MRVVVTMVVVVIVAIRVVVWRLVGLIVRMIVSKVLWMRMNLNHRLNRWMCMVMLVIVRMVMIVVMRHSVIVVMPTHTIFHAKLTVFTTIARHQRLRFAAFQIVHALFQQLKNLTLKTKVGG